MDTVLKLASAALLLVSIVCVICFILGAPLMWLWNTTLPELFGLPVITFWQAVRLMIICSLLFKSSSSSSSTNK